MKLINQIDFGFADAENYKRKENKEFLNRIFIRDEHLEELCHPKTSFLIGEKGTGKTAYAIFLSNSEFKNTSSKTYYIRETEYQKFVSLKNDKHLFLSEFVSIWKVIIYLLISKQIINSEDKNILNNSKLKALNDAIAEYYQNAFSPEIIQALGFVQEAKVVAELFSKHFSFNEGNTETKSFSEDRFQHNLFYIQKKFEDALSKIKLKKNYLIFIDRIDIRPSSIPYELYLDCIKGLAGAIWEVNNDFFPNIKDSKGRMRVTLLIRPDIFASLGLQNQNTKIRDNSVFLNWQTDYHMYRDSKIFKLFNHMLNVQQDDCEKQDSLWDHYFPWESTNVHYDTQKPTSFISFLRWSYHRPRDILTMLSILKKNNEHNPKKAKFESNDFENNKFQREYSIYLLGEVKDQLSFYYSNEDYEIFLNFFEFLSGKDKFDYSFFVDGYNKLLKFIESTSKTIPKFLNTANDFLQFLFDLNVICYIEKLEETDTYRKETFIHWCFRDRSYANVSPKVKTNVEYQIFYGLAKALNVGRTFKN